MSASGLPFNKSHRSNPGRSFSEALRDYLPGKEDLGEKDKGDSKPDVPIGTERLPIQARIDLHGMTLDDARRAVDRFLKDAASRGIRKVLIIHGKGLHSQTGEAVLRQGILTYLEGHPVAGRREHAAREDGGKGALYVHIRVVKK